MERCVLLLSLFLAGICAQKITTPQITQPNAPRTQYITQSQKVVLSCQAEGDPAYKWYKDNKPIVSNGPANPNVVFDSRSGELTIDEYDLRNDGDYMCYATINDVTSMSHVQTLLQLNLGPFKKAADLQMNVNEFDYAKLECANQGKIVAAPGAISYNWYITDKSKQINLDNDRLFIDKKGNLHFTYVKTTDSTKQYLCGYAIVSLKVILMGNIVLMAVDPVNAPGGIKPTAMYSSQGVQGILDSSVRLECFFSGYDPNGDHLPSIKWFDSNNKEIKSSEKFVLSNRNRVLTVHKLDETDDKSFYCQGFTSSGNTDQIEVPLNVTSKPIWKQSPFSQVKAEKKTAVFHCDARSLSKEEPPSPPEWYINGKLADNSLDHRKYVFSNDKKTLTITNVKKPSDILCLQCRVSNSIGTITGDACLNVVSPIEITKQPEEVQKIKKGDIIDLKVVAKTDPDISENLSYEWTFKNTTYNRPNLPPFVEYDPVHDFTFINTSKLTTSEYDQVRGIYTCRIYHRFDEVTIRVDVKLEDVLPPAPVAASAGIDMWIIGLAIGVVFLIVVIAIIVFVICRKQQEGDYHVGRKETGAGLDPEKELRDKGFNDLSRPDYDDYDFPEKKPRGDLEYDDVPIGGDDESLGEYGDEEDTHFNEDGSFIGIYQKKENERHNYKSESTI